MEVAHFMFLYVRVFIVLNASDYVSWKRSKGYWGNINPCMISMSM